MRAQSPLQDFLSLSARIGADPLLVQGAGGNTSIKLDGRLIVKASGARLSASRDGAAFVDLDLAEVRAIINAGGEKVSDAAGRRASIEAALHAALDDAVILHVHSVRTLAYAIRSDGEQALAQKLDGVAWAWAPYVRPGGPLAQSVLAARARTPGARVFVLGNHGLVVTGASSAEAGALLDEVERRLDTPPRTVALPAAIEAALPGYRQTTAHIAHALAFDAAARNAATGTLYPDHVVFLGPGASVIARGDAAPSLGGEPARFVIVTDAGVLVRADLSAEADEMAGCLAEVLLRTPHDAPLAYLGAEEEAGLLGWEAEKYRQELAKRRAQSA